MYIWLSRVTFSAVLAISWPCTAEEPLKATRAPVGASIEVTAGQEFYAERRIEKIPAFKLSKPFKSSMGGSMGLPFGFAIDTDTLVRVNKALDGREYFLPVDGKFRAYHGIMGSVLAPGDTVGLLVYGDGQMEWFVDNSIYIGMPTVWTRKVKEKDPTLTRFETERSTPLGTGYERLVYLGVDENQRAKIRHERGAGSNVLRDEFTFPLDAKGRGVGAVRGAEFFIEAGPLRATITVTKPMTTGLGEIQE